jgi:hypothetical protein
MPTSSAAKSAGKFSSNNIRICRDSFVGCIKHRNGEFALYRWKLVQKFIKALATLQVIEKGTDWNTSTDKHQAAAEDIGVSVRNIGKCGHGTSPYSAVSISLVGSGT